MNNEDKQTALPEGPSWKRLWAWLEKMREPTEVPVVRVIRPMPGNRVKLVPGPFSVQVVGHRLPTVKGVIDCWTYVTQGFQQHQLPEIVFTLVRQPNETAAPVELIPFFEAVYQSTVAGDRPHVGAFAVNLLGRKIVHIPTPSLPGVPVPAGALGAILVTRDELEAVIQFGLTRVMARLGQAAVYYPCPPWSDPEREGIPFDPVRERTNLAKVPCLPLRGSCVYQEQKRVILRLPRKVGDALANKLAELPKKTAFALLTELAPDADGCAVWVPGQTEMTAITPEGSRGERICGCFLMIATGPAKDGAWWLEDGFAAFLKPGTWLAFREAVSQKQRLHIPATDKNMPLCLEWTEAG